MSKNGSTPGAIIDKLAEKLRSQAIKTSGIPALEQMVECLEPAGNEQISEGPPPIEKTVAPVVNLEEEPDIIILENDAPPTKETLKKNLEKLNKKLEAKKEEIKKMEKLHKSMEEVQLEMLRMREAKERDAEKKIEIAMVIKKDAEMLYYKAREVDRKTKEYERKMIEKLEKEEKEQGEKFRQKFAQVEHLQKIASLKVHEAVGIVEKAKEEARKIIGEAEKKREKEEELWRVREQVVRLREEFMEKENVPCMVKMEVPEVFEIKQEIMERNLEKRRLEEDKENEGVDPKRARTDGQRRETRVSSTSSSEPEVLPLETHLSSSEPSTNLPEPQITVDIVQPRPVEEEQVSRRESPEIDANQYSEPSESPKVPQNAQKSTAKTPKKTRGRKPKYDDSQIRARRAMCDAANLHVELLREKYEDYDYYAPKYLYNDDRKYPIMPCSVEELPEPRVLFEWIQEQKSKMGEPTDEQFSENWFEKREKLLAEQIYQMEQGWIKPVDK